MPLHSHGSAKTYECNSEFNQAGQPINSTSRSNQLTEDNQVSQPHNSTKHLNSTEAKLAEVTAGRLGLGKWQIMLKN